MAEDTNKYSNNVILTEAAFKHLLQNVVVQNTTTGGTTTFYRINEQYKKQELNNLNDAIAEVQTVETQDTTAVGTISITKVNGSTTSAPINLNLSNYVTKDNAGNIKITSTADGTIETTEDNITTYTGNVDASISTDGGIYAVKNIWGNKVFNAVFNDYAEYRKTCVDAKPGMCVKDNDDGSLSVTDGFLIPGAQVVSDTFGHAMGMTEDCQTPVAVAGRVLVYPYQDRRNYHAGMCVCSAPGGKVNIMSRKDIMEYPDAIVGIVSEIPEYETWGSDNVKVDGRIWIKVR